ncbi:MAG: hypothetical protein JNL08_04495 [Planctomycetes bacterium]|nr:hypothetical protein [Planctomycetota bacterium]
MNEPRPDAPVVSDEELLALFAPHRPDATAFARGVAERLRARGDRDGAAPRRAAAARVPIDLAWFGAGKWTPWTLPFSLLTLVGAAFLVSWRLLRSVLSRSPAPPRASAMLMFRRQELALGVLLVALGLLGALQFAQFTWLPELLLLLLVATMLLLVLVVRRQARSGLDRRAVASLALGAIETVLLFGLFWFLPDGMWAGAAQWTAALPWLFAAAIVVIVGLAPRAWPEGVVPLGVLGAFVVLVPAPRRADLDALAAAVAALPAPTAADSWLAAADLALYVGALRDHGREVAVPPAVDRALRAARDAEPAAFFALTAELALGRLDAAELRRLAARRDHASSIDRLLTRAHPLRPESFREYEVAMLLAVHELDEGQRDRLAARLLAGLAEATDPLPAWAVAARWLERLDRLDLLRARRDEVHALLVQLQHFGPVVGGAFASWRDLAIATPAATSAAIELMGRVGVPAGVDLPALHLHLRRASRLYGSRLPHESPLALRACVDRLRLERIVGVPWRSPGRTLLEERAFVAVLALLVLCVLAVRAVPRPVPAGAGAAP